MNERNANELLQKIIKRNMLLFKFYAKNTKNVQFLFLFACFKLIIIKQTHAN